MRVSPVASYLAAVVASQMVSPILWDHYALLLVLPVAWLLSRGQWWAAVIPLVTMIWLVNVTPNWAYPVVYWVTFLAVLWQGRGQRPAPDRVPAEPSAEPSAEPPAEPSAEPRAEPAGASYAQVRP